MSYRQTPVDDRFFADPPEFQNAKFVAFGMTRRAGRSVSCSALMPSSRSTSAASFSWLSRSRAMNCAEPSPCEPTPLPPWTSG